TAEVESFRLPEDLASVGFRCVMLRNEVIERCGRDVTVFVDVKSSQEVRGVVYNSLTSVLPLMLQSHDEVMKSSPRQMNRSMVNYGCMVGVSNRLPQGGRLGDTYALYLATQIDPSNLDKTIRMVANTGRDAAFTLDVLRSASPRVFGDIRTATRGASTRLLGPFGVNGVYCSNYIAPQHRDNDLTFTTAVQLRKASPCSTDFLFVYSEWGIVIDTLEGCVFWFDGSDLHGTLSCKKGDLDWGTAYSSGIGFLVRHRDAVFASSLSFSFHDLESLTRAFLIKANTDECM
ncbi:hypothetical protein AAF712_016532, partial [Marasmius tenuissimus]